MIKPSDSMKTVYKQVGQEDQHDVEDHNGENGTKFNGI